MKESKVARLAGLGVVSAVGASLCCIAPLLALLAGGGSVAARFSWLEPLRPVFVGFTVVALGLAWYQKLRPRTDAADCTCEAESWVQGRAFLGVVTVFALSMLAFPWYADVFYLAAPKKGELVADFSEVQYIELDIGGMTCTGCEAHIRQVVMRQSGVVDAVASYEVGSAVVGFVRGRTDTATIRRAIEAAGYEVIGARLAVERDLGR